MTSETPTQAIRLLTCREAAAYLAISERSIWLLIQSQRLPSIHWGRTRRIDRDDLDRFIQAAKTGAK